MNSYKEMCLAATFVSIVEAVVRAECRRAFRLLSAEGEGVDTQEMSDKDDPGYQPQVLSPSFTAECTLAGTVLARAMSNRRKCRVVSVRGLDTTNNFSGVLDNFDAVRYATTLAGTKDTGLDSEYRELAAYGCSRDIPRAIVTVPTLFLDSYGVVVACYLPDLLLPSRQVGNLWQLL